jgi:anti-sigma regulatory factor (Ser/Thr protein kinase)
MNVIIYAGSGDVSVRIGRTEINMEFKDSGPGIEDTVQAMQPGYSTAPDWVRSLGFGAGMGLPNIRRCSDSFKLTSEKGAGVCLDVMILTGAA